EPRADVARGVNVRVGGLQPVVDGNPVPPVMAHADRVEIETVHVGHPAGADQDLLDDHLLLSLAAGEMNDLLVAPLLDAVDLEFKVELPPVPPQGFLDTLGGVRILPGQDLRMIAQDMDPGAETRESLSQLATDRPGADHRQAWRPLREREDGFIGEEACPAQPPERRSLSERAGRD